MSDLPPKILVPGPISELTLTDTDNNSYQEIFTLKREPLDFNIRSLLKDGVIDIAPERALSFTLITEQRRLPMPLNPRGLFRLEIDVNYCDFTEEDCDDGRPDTGMLYPRG